MTTERERMYAAWTAYYDVLIASDAEYGGISTTDFDAGYLAGLKRAEELCEVLAGNISGAPFEESIVQREKDAIKSARRSIATIIEELSRDG